MTISTTFRDELLAAIPHLRAHAHAMCHNAALADDLVQDTLVRCWSKCHQFEPGTNFIGWAYTILRNLYISHARRRRREVEDASGSFAATLVSPASQEASSALGDLRRALMRLPQSQRDALLLVTIEDLSCEEAAKVLGCNVGTVKSRVSRARDTLAKLMGDDRRAARPTSQLGPSPAATKTAKRSQALATASPDNGARPEVPVSR
jgi:RNA polymerase sigma-70 factor (ECF subfamily)